MGLGPVTTKRDIVKRQIKFFTNGLKKINPEIMLNPPPIKYLRKYNLHQIPHVFPTGFKCYHTLSRIETPVNQ